MFRRAGNTLKPQLRRLHGQASSSTRGARQAIRAGTFVSSSVLATYILWQLNSRVIHNDTGPPVPLDKSKERPSSLLPCGNVGDLENLHTVVWGSNRSNTLVPDAVENIRTLSIATSLDGVALRDLVLHKSHAACVDAHGDVYQWGSGFSGSGSETGLGPTLTLRNKNIVQLKLTDGRLYALSESGKVYALATDAEKQKLPARVSTRWSIGWLWGEGETVDFVEITAKQPLARGEKFVSIEAGNDHLLAITSKNRAFAHPVTKNANAYGQLGFRKFEIPDRNDDQSKARYLEVELIPKSTADPYAKGSRSSRPPPTPTMSPNLDGIEDTSIRFCPHLFEIPVLRGVGITQIAAGGRTSFARTISGRVLGWGANEYGQVGLGSNVVMDSIIVPTEVILWRVTSPRTETRCLDITAGGDLTAFTVERIDGSSSRTIDVLMCGNGQWGGLGSNIYSNAQSVPLRAKNVSGLLEYSDTTQKLQPIAPHAVTISPTGHVLLTLNTSSEVDVGGRDLVVWGKNHESELGNGKKSSLPVPTTLETSEGRFMLKSRKAKEVRGLDGKVWKRNVEIEQQATVGFGNSAVFWRISKR